MKLTIMGNPETSIWLHSIVKYLASVMLAFSIGHCSHMDQSILDRDARVTDYLGQLIQNKEFPGLQYVVLNANSVIFEKAAGYADVKNQVPMTLDNRMPVFSTTKTVTAAAILQLEERGLLNIDEKLKTYIPDMPYVVTLRQMLSHSSGIPNPMWGNFLIHWPEEHAAFDRKAKLRKVVADNPDLAFSPGTSIAYSNLAFAILGEVIETVSGLSYEEYIRQNILKPLGVSDHEMGFDIESTSDQAKPYYRSDSFFFSILASTIQGQAIVNEGNWISLRYPWYFDFPGHGSLVGKPSGFAKYLGDLLSANSVLLSSESRDKFFSKQNEAYAIGWHIIKKQNFKAYEHSGSAVGYMLMIRIYRDKGIATILFTNNSEWDKSAIMDTLDAEFLK